MRATTTLAAVAAAFAVGLAWTGSALAYPWPVKPFTRPHPVRGNFGDPRTVFAGPPARLTLYSGGGAFQFHDGVDISAPDGAAVYPVEPGTVTRVTKEWVGVASAGRLSGATIANIRGDTSSSPVTILCWSKISLTEGP